MVLQNHFFDTRSLTVTLQANSPDRGEDKAPLYSFAARHTDSSASLTGSGGHGAHTQRTIPRTGSDDSRYANNVARFQELCERRRRIALKV